MAIFKNPDRTKTVKLQMRLEEDLATEVSASARARGTTVSSIVRNLLRGYLKRERELERGEVASRITTDSINRASGRQP